MIKIKSVGTRLLLAFGSVMVVFAVAGLASLYRLTAFNHAIGDITGPEYAKVELAEAWKSNLEDSMRYSLDLLVLEDKELIRTETEKVRELSEQRTKLADDLAAVENAEGRGLLQAAMGARDKLKPLDEEYLREIEAGDLKAAKATLLEQSRPAQIASLTTLTNLVAYQKVVTTQRADELAATYWRAVVLHMLLSALALVMAGALTLYLTRSIKKPLGNAIEVLGEIEKGNYQTAVALGSNDELGRMLRGLDGMQTALRERTERERAMAEENARIRCALDRATVGVMLADNDGRIIYLNNTVHAILTVRGDEIRRQIPAFDADRLLGASMDAFHSTPGRQRNMLAGMTAGHTAEFKLGGAVLRVIANPVTDANGARIGTVVQWVDRTQEVATENEIRTTVAQAIDGDLTARISEQGKEGFFKMLAHGINDLIASMAEVVRTIARASSEVQVGSEEISRGNADLSHRTEQQASSLQQTASSMEEMTATVNNNADNATQANQMATTAREQAEKGGEVVGAAVAAMAEINASSKRIADIITVIDEIAFQTNLLALNAAVEAARAGDQGRGFAVVAAEVRTLASRSAEAAKEIKSLIQDSVGRVTEGTRLVDESGKALGEIVVAVKKVTAVIADIAGSSREQADGIAQVNKAITVMDDVTQQNAALVEEASAAAHALAEQASQLTQIIGRYRTGEAAATQSVAEPPARAPQHAPPVERRSATRPFTGKRDVAAGAKSPAPGAAPRAAAPLSTVPRRAAAEAEAEEWKDF